MKHGFSRMGKLRNEPTRSARQFKVWSSRLKVVGNYETKPIDRIWAKSDRPRMESRGKQHLKKYQTNPFPCLHPSQIANFRSQIGKKPCDETKQNSHTSKTTKRSQSTECGQKETGSL